VWIGFQTHCIPTESLWKSPQNPRTDRTRKSSIPIPHTIGLFVRCILNKHIYPVHVACYCVCSITIMKKKCCKTNKKLDCIGEIQTATTTFIGCLTRFRLISHIFQKISIESSQAQGIHYVPITISLGISIPTATLNIAFTS